MMCPSMSSRGSTVLKKLARRAGGFALAAREHEVLDAMVVPGA